jgi:HlyD family secretion protein
VRQGTAMFTPVKVGITGEEHFQVLEGIQTGDTVVAGPYQAVRDMKDSTRVKQAKEVGATKRPGGGE